MKLTPKLLVGPKPLAVVLVGIAAWASYTPKAADTEVAALAQRFTFERHGLSGMEALNWSPRIGMLAPRFQHIEAYLDAFLPTGAAFADLDGSGYTDEACLTNPFTGEIMLASVPDKKNAHPLIHLSVAPLRYDARGMTPTGCLVGDFDEDGSTDLLVYFWGRTPVVFLQQPRTPGAPLTAADFKAVELVEGAQTWYTQAITSADVTGDGHLDLIVANYFPDDAKVLNDDRPGDSRMNKGFGAALNGAYNRLLMNEGGRSGSINFREAQNLFNDELGGSQWHIALGAQDLDGDLLPEVLFINDHGADRILHNESTPGVPKFSLIKNHRDFFTAKSETPGQDDLHGMGIDFGDLNNSGLMGWGVSNFGANYVFRNYNFAWINTGDTAAWKRGTAPFVDQSEAMGLARTDGVPWDLRYGDFDNAGQLEVFQSIGFMRGSVNRVNEFHETALQNDLTIQFPETWHHFGHDDDISGQEANTFFVRRSNGQFTDIGAALGFHEASVSRGVATSDVYGDGRIDLLVANQYSAPSFYVNRTKSDNRFLALNIRLPYGAINPDKVIVQPGLDALSRGPKSRAAVGTSVTLTRPDGTRSISAVDGGTGFGGKRDQRVHFGLGKVAADADVNVDLAWRDLTGTRHDAHLTLKPGWHTVWLGSTAELAEVQP